MNFFELSDATRPPDLERRLRERGAELTETLAVLALDLTGRRCPTSTYPADVEVRQVLDLDDLRAADRIDVEVFGGSHADEEPLAAVARRGSRRPEPRCSCSATASPVGTAGHVVAGDDAPAVGRRASCPRPGTPAPTGPSSTTDCAPASTRAARWRWSRAGSRPRRRCCCGPGFQQYGEVRAYRLARG